MQSIKLLTLLLFLNAANCAHSVVHGHPGSVEALYGVALDDMESGLYPEALKEFAEVKSKFPYSRFAALAELRIADTHFKRAKYIEAIDSYRNFLKFHPNHEDAAYAMFRVAEAYFEQIPEDWWFMPPSTEKDQLTTRLAITAYQDFLARFPRVESAEVAQEHLKACKRKLADHEMYVARFYFSRNKWVAAAERAEGVLTTYPGVGLDREALWMVGKAQYEKHDVAAADTALKRLTQEFPDSPEAHMAANLLQTLHLNTESIASPARPQ